MGWNGTHVGCVGWLVGVGSGWSAHPFSESAGLTCKPLVLQLIRQGIGGATTKFVKECTDIDELLACSVQH